MSGNEPGESYLPWYQDRKQKGPRGRKKKNKQNHKVVENTLTLLLSEYSLNSFCFSSRFKEFLDS